MSSPDAIAAQRRALVGLARSVLFPQQVETIELTEPDDLRALARLNALDGQCIAVPLKHAPSAPGEERFHPVGTLARVVVRTTLPGGGARVVLQGLRRVRLGLIVREEGCLWAACERLESVVRAPDETSQARAELAALLDALVAADQRVSRELPAMLALCGADDERATDLIGSVLALGHTAQSQLLCEHDPARRIASLTRMLEAALVRARAGRQLDERVAERVRRRYLRAELAELESQLGEPSEHEREVERLSQKVAGAPLSPGAHAAALRELDHLRHAAPSSQAAARTRAYLAWLLELPWPARAGLAADPYDFEAVEALLNQGHHGLADVKRRIGEFLAVRRLNGTARGTVLCFLGPPGTGKSSMGRAVAAALGRPFLTIPVGTITHERELVGLPHERSSGRPGVILAGLQRVRASNPVILLDEIDKISLGGEGHAAGALLQLLDPEQNSEFLDHYMGVPFDLSGCLFLATATESGSVPEALLDRMETIDFPGYSEAEKFEIARTHLIPRAREYAGLDKSQMQVTPAALRAIIRGYTEEAGVRQLQRQLISLARKSAVRAVRGEPAARVRRCDLSQLLGPRTVEEDLRVRRPAIGVTTGLAWTSAGGSLLPIEALSMPGSGRLILTGQLGDVLRESVQTAVSYVRTFCTHLGLESDSLDDVDLHLHLPSAATPKDGPSAGVAIAVALVSLLTRQPARHDVAMTGEMSLLGQVLNVGGIREKLLAAIRAGVPEVILPARNGEDCLRLDPEIRNRVRIHLIQDVREALAIAMLDGQRERHSVVLHRSIRRRAAKDARDGS